MEKTMLPPPFVRQMRELLGDDWGAFEAALQAPAPVSVRMNPRKPLPPGYLAQWPHTKPVPWHPDGLYLSDRPVFTLDPVCHAGAYYVQEASSMLLYQALVQTLPENGRLTVLDLCAAPGGKTTLMEAFLAARSEPSLLVANEAIKNRTAPLRENLERWGAHHLAICSAEVEVFARLEGMFDVVMTDAPCSGEGLFRKDPEAVSEWSLPHVEFCAARQKRILAAAVQALAPGGVLIYSTCTYNTQENEANASWLAAEFGLQELPLHFPAEWGVQSGHCYPHKVRGEGFYIAAFRKTEGKRGALPASGAFAQLKPLPKALQAEALRWLRPDTGIQLYQTPSGEVLALPAGFDAEYLALDKVLKTKWFGVHIGEFKGKDFIPSHALALSRICTDVIQHLDLDLEKALLFLKKETFDLPAGTPTGWTLARYAGLNLGWMKVLPNRMNNYLPPERRIRMELPAQKAAKPS